MQLDFVQNNMIQLGVPTTVPARFASRDIAAGGLQYQGRILDEPVVEQGFFDSFWGVTKVTTVRFRLANADHALDLYHTRDVRGTTLTITRYDEITATSVVEFTGKISTTALAEDALEVEAVAPDLSVFEQLIPRGTVDVTTFPKAVDVGATIPVIFGNVVAHRCLYVSDDTGVNRYDYLVGRGALTVSAVYRDGPGSTLYAVGAGEYTVETTRYAGLTTLRFTTRQTNFANAFHLIYADVTGLSAERNFARAVKTLLSDTTYGLAQTVNAASFTTAEAALPASFYCDGAMTTTRAASDVLRALLMVRGMMLNLNAAGEWICTVDTQQADVRMTIQDGTGDGERNLIAVTSPRRRALAQDSIGTYALQYRLDGRTGAYRLRLARLVNGGFGRDVSVTHPFIRDTTTADTVLCYLANREIWGNELLDVDVTQEARKAVPGDRVTLTYAPVGWSGQTMEVRDVRKGLDRIGLSLALWSANFYTYTAAAWLPTDPAIPTPTQSAKTTRTDTTPPTVPVGLATAVGTGKLVSLSWTADTDEDLAEYGVYRFTADVPASGVLIAKVRTNRFADAEVTIGTAYYYWVTAFDFSTNESAKSTSVTATPTTVPTGAASTTPPSDPGAATKSAEGVYQAGDGSTLAYFDIALPAMPASAVYMNLLIKQAAAAQYRIVGQATAGSITMRADGLVPGQSYNVALVAFSAFGYASGVVAATGSPFTAVGDTTAPAVPAGLAAAQGTGKTVELTWTANTEADLAEYGVYRNTVNNAGTATLIAKDRTTKFIDAAVTLGTAYWYWITAIDNSGNASAKSAGTVTLTPALVPATHVDNTAPSAPAAATKSADASYLAGDGSVSASMDIDLPAMPTLGVVMDLLVKLSAATNYQIYGQSGAGSVTLRVDGLVPGQSYNVAVQAYSAFGIASAVTQATGSPFTAVGDTTAPGVPAGLAAATGSGGALLTWTPNTESDLALYRVYRNTTDNAGTATKIADVLAAHYTDVSGTKGQLYYYYVTAVDRSGNASAKTTAASGVFVSPVSTDPGVTFSLFEEFITAQAALTNNGLNLFNYPWQINSTSVLTRLTSTRGILHLIGSASVATLFLNQDAAGLGLITAAGTNPTLYVRIGRSGAGAGTRRAGLMDAVPAAAEPTNGIYIRFTNGNYLLVCRSGGVETTLDTGVASADGTLNAFRLLITTASVRVFVDGVDKSNITTNIPTADLGPALTTPASGTDGFDVDYVAIASDR